MNFIQTTMHGVRFLQGRYGSFALCPSYPCTFESAVNSAVSMHFNKLTVRARTYVQVIRIIFSR